MANKRRPKKSQAPYKCYGPNGVVKRISVSASTGGFKGATTQDEDEDELDEMSVLKGGPVEKKGEDHPLNKAGGEGAGMVEIPARFGVTSADAVDEVVRGGEEVFPVEIFELIMKHTRGKNLNYLLVSKMFYSLYIPMIYYDPKLDSSNFYRFVETMTAKKSRLGSLVHRMDLSPIIQSGKNSYVSKLLRRCSASLETFIAPQTSFGISPLISLRSCTKIRILDLGLVSETVNLNQLFHAIKNSKELTHLSFPRSSISCEDHEDDYWPENLQFLRLSGGITDEFVTDSVFPRSIKTLQFAHCPVLKDFAIYNMLSKFGESLKSLSFHYPMPALSESSMDFIFTYCPNLTFLQITVDYCSRFLFGEELLPLLPGMDRPLRTLWIESSGGLGQGSKIHPDDLTIAIMEQRLPNLKNVRVTPKLGWNVASDDIAVLVDLLEENGGGLYVSNC